MIYNYFIDTSIYNDKSDFMINLVNPIILKDNQKLRFKLISFSSLNNVYNISQELNNNIFNLKKYKKTLIIGQSPALTVSPVLRQVDVSPYYTTVNTFPATAPNVPIETRHFLYVTSLFSFYVEEVVLENYILYLGTDRITTADENPFPLYFKHMFLDVPPTDTALMIPCFNQYKTIDTWFIINKPSGLLDQLNRVEVDIYFNYDNHQNPDAGTITVELCKQSSGVVSVIGTTVSNYTVIDMLANNTRRIDVPVITDPNTATSTYIVRFSTTGFKEHAIEQFFFNKINFIKNDFGYYEESDLPVELEQEVNITIPDGIYSATTLITKLNLLLTSFGFINTKFSLQTYNYKLLITNTDIITGLTLYDLNNLFQFTFTNKLASMLGFNNIVLVNRLTVFEGNKTINLLNFQKYLITTNLSVLDAVEVHLKNNEYNSDGIGDVITVINKDVPPFQYINYINTENIFYEIKNRVINNIGFKILNEFKQSIKSISGSTIQFQLQVLTRNKNNVIIK